MKKQKEVLVYRPKQQKPAEEVKVEGNPPTVIENNGPTEQSKYMITLFLLDIVVAATEDHKEPEA